MYAKGLPEISANSLLGFCVASALIGCIISGACCGFLSSKYGRKKALLIAAVLFLISALSSAYPEFGLRDIDHSDESPRWLVLQNKFSQAEITLLKLLGEQSGKKELQNIVASLESRVVKGAPLLSFGIGVIVIGILLSVFQQFVGINVALYYAPEIFKSLGSSTDSALLQTILMGAINLSCTTIAIFTVDKYGRKPLQIIGAVGMAIGMFILGTAFYANLSGSVALTGMLFYVASFAISWGPVCWVLLAEIFPNAIRSQALAIAVAAQWIANYIVSWTFPMMDKSSYLLEHFNHGFAYWVYGVMSVLAAIFMWKFVPETKGKTLEELELLWHKK